MQEYSTTSSYCMGGAVRITDADRSGKSALAVKKQQQQQQK